MSTKNNVADILYAYLRKNNQASALMRDTRTLHELLAEAREFEARDPNILRLINDSGDVRKLEDIEAEAIRFAIAHYRGQMSQMARKLGICRSTLYRKMNKIGINAAITKELRS